MVEDFLARLQPFVERRQAKIYPGTIATDEQIGRFERRHEVTLPHDYRRYLQQVGRCRIHSTNIEAEHDFAIKLFALQDVKHFHELAYGREMNGIPDCWFAIADLQEHNFIVIPSPSISGERCAIVDGHSMIAHLDAPIIAVSFTEFFERTLEDPDTSSGSGNADLRYWSKGVGGNYGNARDIAKS